MRLKRLDSVCSGNGSLFTEACREQLDGSFPYQQACITSPTLFANDFRSPALMGWNNFT